MSTLLNLFLLNRSKDKTTLIQRLRKFMYTEKPMPTLNSPPIEIEEYGDIEPVVVPELAFVREPIIVTETKAEDIRPSQPDTLFWCLYIIHFGYGEYMQIARNYGVRELEIKKKVADHILANPTLLKQANFKITKVAQQEIVSELLTSQKETSILALYAIASYFQVHLLLLHEPKHVLVEIRGQKDVENPTYVLFKDSYQKYRLRLDALTEEEIRSYKHEWRCLESHMKPLRAISTYKTAELVELATHFGLYNAESKPKKADMYHTLAEHLSWV